MGAEAAAFGFGGHEAISYTRVHGRDALRLRRRSPDGRSFLSRSEFSKPTAEEQIAKYTGNLFLTEMLGGRSSRWADDPVWSEAFNDEYRGRDISSTDSAWIR